MQIQLQQIRQNILDFLKYLDDNYGSFYHFIDNVKQTQLRHPNKKHLPYISPSQIQEYDNILEQEGLNFLQRHQEVRDTFMGSVFNNNPGTEFLVRSYITFPQHQQEIRNSFKSAAYEFLWNNYSLLQQIKMVPLMYFR